MDIDKKVSGSLGLLERLEDNLSILEDCCRFISEGDTRTLADNTLVETKQILSIFEESFNPLELADQAALSGYTFRSKIYQLGIASEIIRLREAGNGMRSIANSFNVSETAVARFLKHYDSLSAVAKAKIKTSSVMNTTDRLEDLMTMILRQLHRLEGVNDDVHVKYIGELRQTLGLAAQVSEKIATYKAYQNFREAVQTILVTELPERRLEIIKKLKSLQGAGDTSSQALPLNPVGH